MWNREIISIAPSDLLFNLHRPSVARSSLVSPCTPIKWMSAFCFLLNCFPHMWQERCMCSFMCASNWKGKGSLVLLTRMVYLAHNDNNWPDTVLQRSYHNPLLRICSWCCASAPGAALQGSELMDWDFSEWHHYRSMIRNTVSVSELVDWDLSILHHSRSLMIHSKLIPAQCISVDWLRLSILQHSLSINDHPQQTDPQVP